MSLSSEPAWFVYMVCCADATLYTGITTDLDKRIKQHNSSKYGAKYTRSRQPVSLVYFEQLANRSLASKREYEIKRLTTQEKHLLIHSASGQ